jgi:glycosyltransferase involved in cell wall biosynthesis
MKRKRIVFSIFSVSSLEGGGGAERRFALLFEELMKLQNKYDVFFLTDRTSFNNYQKSNFFVDNAKNIFIFNNSYSRFSKIIESFRYSYCLLRIRANIIQICKPTAYELYFINCLFFFFKRPKKVISVEYCGYAYEIENYSKNKIYNIAQINYLKLLFSKKWDGVFTHYQKFKEELLKSTIISNIPAWFVSPNAFPSKKPTVAIKKENMILYSSRLDKQKDPFKLIYAIKNIYDNDYDLIKDWKFVLLGRGELEADLKNFIDENFTKGLILMDYGSNISQYLQRASVFVSTQHLENYPSFSLTDAMEAGCIPIVQNVGDTTLLVEDNKNGFYFSNEYTLNECLKYVITLPLLEKQRLSELNRKYIIEKHNIKNYIAALIKYYDEL